MKRDFLGLIAKYPEPGKVKTRLAAEVGPETAADVYRLIAGRVFNNTRPVGQEYRRVVFYSPYEQRSGFADWLPGEQLISQGRGDIGAVMKKAVKDLFALGAVKAVVTGVDIPLLGRRIVAEAFRKLDSCDIVLGPANDGGYYLIGMKSLHRAVFQGVTWSTEKVLKETLETIKRMQLTYTLLEALSDVDDKSGMSEMFI